MTKRKQSTRSLFRSFLFSGTVALSPGIALPAAASTITNGGFETGDFTGWVTSPSPPGSVLIVTAASFGPPVNNRVHDGTYAVTFGAVDTGGGVLSQTFSTIPGTTYNLSFWYGTTAYNSYPQSLTTEVLPSAGAVPLLNQTTQFNTNGDPTSQWMFLTFQFVADGSQATIRFADISGITAWADGMIDTVSIDPTPLPAALPLFATGLGALGLLGWRRKRKAKAA